jgi:hypothetical protein
MPDPPDESLTTVQRSGWSRAAQDADEPTTVPVSRDVAENGEVSWNFWWWTIPCALVGLSAGAFIALVAYEWSDEADYLFSPGPLPDMVAGAMIGLLAGALIGAAGSLLTGGNGKNGRAD